MPGYVGVITAGDSGLFGSNARKWFKSGGRLQAQRIRECCRLLQASHSPPGASFGGPRQLPLHMPVCNTSHMATNLALDDRLIEEARKIGHHRTKKEAVTAALSEYVKLRRQQKIIEAFGTFDFDPEYDYKAGRNRRRQ